MVRFLPTISLAMGHYMIDNAITGAKFLIRQAIYKIELQYFSHTAPWVL